MGNPPSRGHEISLKKRGKKKSWEWKDTGCKPRKKVRGKGYGGKMLGKPPTVTVGLSKRSFRQQERRETSCRKKKGPGKKNHYKKIREEKLAM